MNSIIDNINKFLELYLPIMFKVPITVKIKGYKENKNGKIVNKTSLYISYRGVEYSNIRELSGGEQDRLSLAFILALNELMGMKLLLIDESIASLNYELCEDIVKGLQSLSYDTPILIINHNTNNGIYDSIVEL